MVRWLPLAVGEEKTEEKDKEGEENGHQHRQKRHFVSRPNQKCEERREQDKGKGRILLGGTCKVGCREVEASGRQKALGFVIHGVKLVFHDSAMKTRFTK